MRRRRHFPVLPSLDLGIVRSLPTNGTLTLTGHGLETSAIVSGSSSCRSSASARLFCALRAYRPALRIKRGGLRSLRNRLCRPTFRRRLWPSVPRGSSPMAASRSISRFVRSAGPHWRGASFRSPICRISSFSRARSSSPSTTARCPARRRRSSMPSKRLASARPF